MRPLLPTNLNENLRLITHYYCTELETHTTHQLK
nr:MAG TPA: hypothetical protein [Caudoviricetes sp.]